MLRVLSALILAVLVSQPLSAQAPGLATVSVRVAQQEPTTRPITVRSVLSYWSGALSVWDVFMVGFEGNMRLWPHVSLVGSAQRWSRGEVLCAGTGCGPPIKEGWSIGGGVRVAGEPTARVWWPFAQVEFGAHRYPPPRPRIGKVQPFVAGRVGLVARIGSHWEVEIGTKVQRVSGFEYVDRTGGFLCFCEDTHVIVSAKTFAALQLSLGLQLPFGSSD